ncbi:MAG: hypothetical protein H0W76_23840 [Pyrinomonadaceae bacterium]|nr:hypothetical protein [Pyrinomonadaceae bacterium]
MVNAIVATIRNRTAILRARANRRGHCYGDFWEAYSLVIPPEQHTVAGNETGLATHVERWNLTLRQRLGCFVRKSLSFSKAARACDIWRANQPSYRRRQDS